MSTAQRLRDMGIDVWRLRGRAGPTQPDATRPEATQTDVGQVVADPSFGSGMAAQDVEAGTHISLDGQTPDSPATAAATAARDSGPTVAPFTVLCLVRDQAQVLIEPADLRAGRRFAADLLASATGIWGGDSQALLFEWPHAGIENRERAMIRALAAFVERQLHEPGRNLTLIGREVVERLGGQPVGDLIILPRIDELMISGELKRALWVELAGHLTS